MKTIIKAYLCLIFAIIPINAAKFTNQYLEFSLPDGWNCSLEGTEWVCQSLNKERKKESIIILTAKTRGEKDSMDIYMNHLKSPRTIKLPDGKYMVSDPKYSKLEVIKNHKWVSSLHLGSEVPGYYTRYMATVKKDLGIAVTASVSKNNYFQYKKLLDHLFKTLRVFRESSNYPFKHLAVKKDAMDIDKTIFIKDPKYSIKTNKNGKIIEIENLWEKTFLIFLILIPLLLFQKRKNK